MSLVADGPFGKGLLQPGQLDFSFLVEERLRHQTKQEAEGVKTGISAAQPTQEVMTRRQLYRGICEVLREEQQQRGITTGKGHEMRWMEKGQSTASQPAGNTANAAVVSEAAAKNAVDWRAKIFNLQDSGTATARAAAAARDGTHKHHQVAEG